MLVERGAITTTQAIEVVQTAAEVKVQVATSPGESAQRLKKSLALLARKQPGFKSDRLEPCGGRT